MTDNAREGPYRGLTAYTEEDAEFFFGRDREIDLVIANLKASRLTLLYGESGVGKSSVLLAGVMRRLHGDVARNLARHREDVARGGAEHRRLPLAIALFRSPWSAEQPLVQLMGAIHEAVSSAAGEPLPEWKAGDDVVETLRTWTKRVRTILVVLDQFEEYFVHHDEDKAPDTVAGMLPAVVNDVNLRVNFVLSIREDSLGKLDRFKKNTPILANILRINFLDDRAAREAIELPLARYTDIANGGEPYRCEPELVKEVIRQVQARQDDRAPAVSADAGDGAPESNGKGVDTPVLQLVLTRLWEEEQALNSRVLRLETFEQRLESTARIMRSQLERTIEDLSEREKDIASACFRQLVTQSGSKFAQTVTDLSVYAGAPPAEVEEVLKKLAEGQILRSVTPRFGQEEKRYEILHDALGETVLAWSASHLEQRAREEGERRAREQNELARKRAIRRVALGLVGLVVAVSVVALVLYQQGQASSASEKKALAEARAGAADARALIGQDPHEAMTRALESLKPRTLAAETALREAVAQSRLRFMHNAKDEVRVVVASANGQWVLSAGDKGIVDLLRPESRTVRELAGHKAAVRVAAFNRSGTRAVTGGDDKVARVWHVESGDEIAALEGHKRAITAAAFDSQQNVLTASSDGTARIWDASGRPVAILRASSALETAAFSPNEKLIATADASGNVRLWLQPRGGWRSTRTAARVLSGHTAAVRSLAFSRNGRLLATASEDGTARIWNVATGKLRHVLQSREAQQDDEAQPEPVVAVDFNRDATVLVTAAEKTLRFWDVRRGTQFQSVRAGADWLTSIRFRRDGRVVMTAGNDGIVRLWEAATGLLLLELRGHTDRVFSAAFLGDGRFAVTAGADGATRIWNVSTGRELRGIGDWMQGAAFAPGGKHVFGVSADSYVFKWDVKTGKRLWTGRDDNGGRKLNGVAVDPHGVWVVSAGDDGIPTVWDAEDGSEIGYLFGDTEDVIYPVAADPRGGVADDPHAGRVTMGTTRGEAHIWTFSEGSVDELVPLDAEPGADGVQTHRGGVLAIAYSPRGDRIATAGADQTVRVWTSDKGKLLATFGRRQQLGAIGGIAYHPSGKRLATASEDGTVRVWRTSDGKQERALRGSGGPLRAVAFSRDGQLIAAGGTAGQTYVWDWQRPALIGSFRMHADLIKSIAFAADGRILTASDDRTAKLYSCTTCGTLAEVSALARERMAAVR